MKNSVTKYFKGQPVSGMFKSRIRARALASMTSSGLDVSKHPLSNLNRSKREHLASAIFEVENDLESQGDGRPDHPTVVALRAVRNEVYDDLGWNEYPRNR